MFQGIEQPEQEFNTSEDPSSFPGSWGPEMQAGRGRGGRGGGPEDSAVRGRGGNGGRKVPIFPESSGSLM